MAHKHQNACPVCGCLTPGQARVYCSEHCRKLAYNYRKRLAPVILFLQRVEFAVSYQYGVLLSIRLPFVITFAYPEKCHNFTFPDPEIPIGMMNADDLWEEINWQIGDLCGDMLRWLYDRDYDPPLARDMLLNTIRTAMTTAGRWFHCEKCGHTYVESLQARDSLMVCADCADRKGPF